jgi:hypothetical protein
VGRQGLPDRGGRRGGGKQQGLVVHRGRDARSCCSLTFTLLMLQLHSFSRAMLVFLTGPLGIAGVAGALLALNRPFGFVALLGVIALMGMIQRNSVILIDQIEQDRARGVPAWDAIVESAVRRLRPIVLTAAAAVLAMIPAVAQRVLGPDGRGHHGRPDRGDRHSRCWRCRPCTRPGSGSSASRWSCPEGVWGRSGRCRYNRRLTDFMRVVEADCRSSCRPPVTVKPARVAKLVDAPGLGPDAS